MIDLVPCAGNVFTRTPCTDGAERFKGRDNDRWYCQAHYQQRYGVDPRQPEDWAQQRLEDVLGQENLRVAYSERVGASAVVLSELTTALWLHDPFPILVLHPALREDFAAQWSVPGRPFPPEYTDPIPWERLGAVSG